MTKKTPEPEGSALVYSAEVPAPAGVDGERYETVLLVSRRDGKALAPAELAALDAVLCPPAPPRAKARAASRPAAKGASKKAAAARPARKR